MTLHCDSSHLIPIYGPVGGGLMNRGFGFLWCSRNVPHRVSHTGGYVKVDYIFRSRQGSGLVCRVTGGYQPPSAKSHPSSPHQHGWSLPHLAIGCQPSLRCPPLSYFYHLPVPFSRPCDNQDFCTSCPFQTETAKQPHSRRRPYLFRSPQSSRKRTTRPATDHRSRRLSPSVGGVP